MAAADEWGEGPAPLNAKAIVEGVFPGARVTDWKRDPNSALAKKFPDSHHLKGTNAVDVAPIPGMKYDDYISGLEAAGYTILEHRDEASHPIPGRTTGPNWHVYFGGGPSEVPAWGEGPAPAPAEAAPPVPVPSPAAAPEPTPAPQVPIDQNVPVNAPALPAGTPDENFIVKEGSLDPLNPNAVDQEIKDKDFIQQAVFGGVKSGLSNDEIIAAIQQKAPSWVTPENIKRISSWGDYYRSGNKNALTFAQKVPEGSLHPEAKPDEAGLLQGNAAFEALDPLGKAKVVADHLVGNVLSGAADALAPGTGEGYRERAGLAPSGGLSDDMVSAAVSMLTGAGEAKLAAGLASPGALKKALEIFGEGPVKQALGGALGAAAQQKTYDYTGSPVLAMLAGLAGNVGGYEGARHLEGKVTPPRLPEGERRTEVRTEAPAGYSDVGVFPTAEKDWNGNEYRPFRMNGPDGPVNGIIYNDGHVLIDDPKTGKTVTAEGQLGDHIREVARREPQADQPLPAEAASLPERDPEEIKQLNDMFDKEFGPSKPTPEAPKTTTPAEVLDTVHGHVQRRVDELTAGWQNKPDIVVHRDIKDFAKAEPASYRALKKGKATKALGLVDEDGRVHIIAGNIRNPSDIAGVVFHESLGHVGLAKEFGSDLDNLLLSIAKSNHSVRNAAAELKTKYGKLYANRPDAEARYIEEVFARRSEGGQVKVSGFEKIRALIRSYARRAGLKNLRINDNEVKNILAKAHERVVGGEGGKSEGGLRAMYIGGKAKDFSVPTSENIAHFNMWDKAYGELEQTGNLNKKTTEELRQRYGFHVGPDSFPRYEISDQDAQLTPHWRNIDPDMKVRLDDFLQHNNLFRNYPELADWVVTRKPPRSERNFGSIDLDKKIININPKLDFRNTIDTVLHEIQHAIQHLEGHLNGGSPSSAVEMMNPAQLKQFKTDLLKEYRDVYPNLSPSSQAYYKPIIEGILQTEDPKELALLGKDSNAAYKAYTRIYGELEARDTEWRRKLSNEERRALAPNSGEAISPHEIIGFNPNSDFYAPQEFVSDKGPTAMLPRDEEQKYGNLNMDRLHSDEDIGRWFKHFAEQINPADVKPHEDTKELADALGTSVNKFKKITVNVTPEVMTAMRRTLVKSAEDGEKLANRVTAVDASDADRTKFAQWLARHAAFQEHVMGHIRNAAQVLNAMNIHVGSGKGYIDMKVDGGDMLTDPKILLSIANNIKANAGNQKAINKVARDATTPFWEDYLTSFRYAMMLSGTSTHAKNAAGNGSLMAADLIEHLGAAALGHLRGGSFRDIDRVMAREVGMRVWGMVTALKPGSGTYREMAKSYAEGHPTHVVSKIEDAAHVDLGDIWGPLTHIEYGKKALAASDSFFRSILQNGNLNGLAYRKATTEGLKGDQFWDRVDELMTNPTAEMMAESDRAASILQLVHDTSWFGKFVEQGKAKRPGFGPRLGRFALQLALPFTRVTDNMFFSAIRRSPLAPFDKVFREDFAAGGARRDLAIARAVIGSTMFAYFFSEGLAGNLTGTGPETFAAQQQKQATGWRPNTVKGGYRELLGINDVKRLLGMNPEESDQWVSTAGLDAISIQANVAANLAQDYKDGKLDGKDLGSQVLNSVGRIASALAENTIAPDVQSVFGMVGTDSRAQSNQENYVAGLAGSFSPAVVRQMNQLYGDTQARDATGTADFSDKITGRLSSALPGLSKDLPQKYDVFGQPIDYREKNLAGIAQSRAETKDPVALEVQRLTEAANEKKALVGPVQRKDLAAHVKDADASLVQEYQRLSGQKIHEDLTAWINSVEWFDMTDADKVKKVQEVVKDARKETRDEMFKWEEAK